MALMVMGMSANRYHNGQWIDLDTMTKEEIDKLPVRVIYPLADYSDDYYAAHPHKDPLPELLSLLFLFLLGGLFIGFLVLIHVFN
ncbi:hypothetical protein CCP3SC15_480002 [Gammaproteobacteria bacterium]